MAVVLIVASPFSSASLLTPSGDGGRWAAAKARLRGTGATRSRAAWPGEHGEDHPFAAGRRRTFLIVRYSLSCFPGCSCGCGGPVCGCRPRQRWRPLMPLSPEPSGSLSPAWSGASRRGGLGRTERRVAWLAHGCREGTPRLAGLLCPGSWQRACSRCAAAPRFPIRSRRDCMTGGMSGRVSPILRKPAGSRLRPTSLTARLRCSCSTPAQPWSPSGSRGTATGSRRRQTWTCRFGA
jgi:hypothetical protein